MNIFFWIVFGYLALGSLINIGRVGKQRQVKTPLEAVLNTIEYGGLIFLTYLAVVTS